MLQVMWQVGREGSCKWLGVIAADGDGWNGWSKRLPADGDRAEMEQFGGTLAIILRESSV